MWGMAVMLVSINVGFFVCQRMLSSLAELSKSIRYTTSGLQWYSNDFYRELSAEFHRVDGMPLKSRCRSGEASKSQFRLRLGLKPTDRYVNGLPNSNPLAENPQN